MTLTKMLATSQHNTDRNDPFLALYHTNVFPERKFVFFHLLVFVWFLFVFLPACPAWGEDRLHEDLIQELYSTKFGIDAERIPVLTVELSHGLTEVPIQTGKGLQVTAYTPTPKTLDLPPAQTLRVLKKRSSKATLHYFIVLENLGAQDKSLAGSLGKQWADKGIPLTVRKIGGIFALNGQIVNNTRYLLHAGVFKDEAQAKKRLDSLRAHGADRAFLHTELVQRAQGMLQLVDEEDRVLLESHDLIAFQSPSHEPIACPKVHYGQGFKEGVEARRYRGELFVTMDPAGLLLLGNRVNIEDLLKGTVPSEMYGKAPMEALKAQAITARGHLLSKFGTRHLAEPFHLCSTQHCQVYGGVGKEQSRTNRAIEATRGQFLVDQHGLVDTVYSALSGGLTERNDLVWPQTPHAPLQGSSDFVHDRRFDQGITPENFDTYLFHPPQTYAKLAGFNAKFYRWTRRFTPEKLNKLVAKKFKVGQVQNLLPGERGFSGRLKSLTIQGSDGQATILWELPIRRLFNNLPSAAVKIIIDRDAQGHPTAFTFHGAGWGHGVGMSQTGAMGRARAGQNYETILLHYYTGSHLKTLY